MQASCLHIGGGVAMRDGESEFYIEGAEMIHGGKAILTDVDTFLSHAGGIRGGGGHADDGCNKVMLCWLQDLSMAEAITEGCKRMSLQLRDFETVSQNGSEAPLVTEFQPLCALSQTILVQFSGPKLDHSSASSP